MRVSQLRPLYFLILAFSFMVGSDVSEAKTFYVERWGQNNPECGSKTNPCERISYAVMSRAKMNDKIVVGPGEYLDNIAIDENDASDVLKGLKIESSAGRNATIIVAAENDKPVFMVSQPNVQIGKKGKGFTVTGAIASAGIEFDDMVAGKGKVQGNLAFGNEFGFDLAGDRILVRFNIARENTGDGFKCTNCPKGKIQDNHAILNDHDGFDISASGGMVMQKNRSVRNGFFGYRVFSGGGPEATGVPEKYLHNIALDNDIGGFRMDHPENMSLTGNISSLNGVNGFEIRNNTNMSFDAPTVKNNVSVSNNSSGFSLTSTSALAVISNTKMDGNHSVDNNADGIRIASGIQFTSSKNNSTYNNISGCGIRNIDEVNVVFLKHFMSITGTPNTVCNDGAGIAGALTIPKPSPVKATAAKLL